MKFLLDFVCLLIMLTSIYNDKENQFFWFSFLIVFLSYSILYEVLDFLGKRKINIVIFKLDGKKEPFELLEELKLKEEKNKKELK